MYPGMGGSFLYKLIMNKFDDIKGFSLIELTIVIITIGIVAAIAMQSMVVLVTDQRETVTEQEMQKLSDAIVGNSSIASSGHRTDFGYVGDVGAFPPNLDALMSNPGGFATWDGPYIDDNLSEDLTGYKTDEWGSAYNYSGGIIITSTGSGATITKKIADASSDYLLNEFNGLVYDASGNPPGTTYADSLDVKITIPNGSGSNITKTYGVDSLGNFELDSLPVGKHNLKIIYTPNVDTLNSYLTILPRHISDGRVYKYALSYFTSGSSGGGGGGGGSSSSLYDILRPHASGQYDQLSTENCSNNWQCVDEESSDENSSYVKGSNSSYKRDLYHLTSPTVSSGTIDSVVVHIVVRGGDSGQYAKTYMRVNNSNFEGSTIDLSSVSSYTEYTTSYSNNPDNSSSWVWSDLTHLQAGVRIMQEGRCTQVWVEVYYTE